MICRNCNNNFADTAKYCPKCGTKAGVHDVHMRKCPKCGTENLLIAKFCKVDGYNLQQAEGRTIAPSENAYKPPAKVLCPQCGAENAPSAKFCKKDGTPLVVKSSSGDAAEHNKETQPLLPPTSSPVAASDFIPTTAELICPTCGTKNPATAKFCKKDGISLQWKNEKNESSSATIDKKSEQIITNPISENEKTNAILVIPVVSQPTKVADDSNPNAPASIPIQPAEIVGTSQQIKTVEAGPIPSAGGGKEAGIS